MYNFVSLGGIFVILLAAWAISSDRSVINWRAVGWGVALQFVFAFFIFVVPLGTQLFLFLNNIVASVLDSSMAGTRFVFGRLALPPGTVNEYGEPSLGFFLAFQALPTIIFFASIMAALYYVGVMPWLIKIFSKAFTYLMRISGAESLCASSNIFVGVESAVTIRPYIKNMTASELCTVLTAGMATIASSTLALYVFILQGTFPTIAGHLISASILSAPAAIAVSKLIMPETGRPATLGIDAAPYYERESGILEAVINGANAGVKLVIGIVGLLIAFLGIIALFDMCIGYLSGLLGAGHPITIKEILGYAFYPFTIAIGVPIEDAYHISQIIGQRAVATEVKSYQDLASMLSAGTLNNPRSAVLAAYALCGFAHFASLAIFVGGFSALAPERTADISRMGLRALVAATLACLMTAAVAGVFYHPGIGGGILMGK